MFVESRAKRNLNKTVGTVFVSLKSFFHFAVIWEQFRSNLERFDITTEWFKNINQFVRRMVLRRIANGFTSNRETVLLCAHIRMHTNTCTHATSPHPVQYICNHEGMIIFPIRYSNIATQKVLRKHKFC